MAVKSKIVMRDVVLRVLNDRGAKTNDDGTIDFVGDDGVVSFMGAGEELVIPDTLSFRDSDGKAHNLFEALEAACAGFSIMVIC